MDLKIVNIYFDAFRLFSRSETISKVDGIKTLGTQIFFSLSPLSSFSLSLLLVNLDFLGPFKNTSQMVHVKKVTFSGGMFLQIQSEISDVVCRMKGK